MKAALLVVPLLLVPACSGTSDSTRAAATSAPSTAAPSSPTPAPSRSTQPSPAPSPTRAAMRAVDGDVDGDGEPDEIGVNDTTLEVTLSADGHKVTTDVDKGLGTSEPAARAGSVDVDRDGHAEVFVRVGQGASTSTLRMFTLTGSALAPVDSEGAPLLLVLGGSVTHGDGFSCTEAGRLVVRSAESDDGTAFTITTTTYRLAGAAAVRLSRTTAKATGMDDPRVRAAYQVDCGSIGEGE